MTSKRIGKYSKFLLYLVVFVLLNLAAATMFFHIDLTRDHVFSISNISKNVVAHLSEPLTIHVFFTKNLPAPHNSTERYLRDLLQEYGNYANRFFNYQFHDVSVQEEGASTAVDANQQLAQNYGVYPVQIQKIEKDEVKFQKAYMGMALIHGNLVEQIPTITSTDGLEYKITMAIQKMNNKVGALLNLPDKIQIRLFLSSSLDVVAPYIRLEKLAEMPTLVETVVKKLNEKNYDKLAFTFLDPSKDASAQQEQTKYNLFRLQWDTQTDNQGKVIPAGVGVAGLVMQHGGKLLEMPLVRVLKIPLIGTQYQLENPESIEKNINDSVETLININESIGVLADHGAWPLFGGYGQMPGQQKEETLDNFNGLLAQNYSVQQVRLKDEDLPVNFSCLVIPGAKEEFNDYELFQIDQFLMQGKSIAIFLDSFNEIMPGNQNQMMYNQNQGPFYIPLKTGLEKLLNHWGLGVKTSYVLDENCYKQRIDEMYGGGEQSVYFAPLIQAANINDQLPFMANIEQLIMVKISPLELNEKRAKEFAINPTPLFFSSDKSWEMSGRINLNPNFIQKPEAGDSSLHRLPLAYLLEGEFPSYFAGKPIPEKPGKEVTETNEKNATPAKTDMAKGKKSPPKGKAPANDKQPAAKADQQKTQPTIDMARFKGEAQMIRKGRPGKIFLIGSAEILRNNVLDQEGRSPNAIFLMNVLDFLNQRLEVARMRSKQQRLNLLKETSAGTKTLVKTFNIVGLPILVIAAGLVVWLRRRLRQKKIQARYGKK